MPTKSPVTPQATSTRHYLWVLLAVTAALALCMGIGRFAYTPIIPIIQQEVALSLVNAGYIASSNYFGYLVGAILPLLISSWVSRYTMLFLSIVLTIVSFIAMPLTESVIWWSMWRFISGVASAFGMIATSQIVLSVLAQSNKSTLAGILYSGIGIGVLLSSLLVNNEDALHMDWKGLWYSFSAICLFLGLPALWILRIRLPKPPQKSAVTPPELITWLAISYGLTGFGYVITVTFLPVLQGNAENADFTSWIWVGISAIPSTILWSFIAKRIGKENALISATLLQSISVAIPIFIPTSYGLILSAALLGGTFLGIVSLSLDLAHEITQSKARVAITVITIAYAIGQILGPGAAGYLAELNGNFTIPLSIASLTLLVSALGFWNLRRMRSI